MKIIPILGVENCLCTEIHVHTLMDAYVYMVSL